MPLERMASSSLIFSVALSGIFMEPGAEGSALGGVGFGVGLINSGSLVAVYWGAASFPLGKGAALSSMGGFFFFIGLFMRDRIFLCG